MSRVPMLQARLIVNELKRLDATHVLTVPDNASKALLEQIEKETAIRVLPVTREGEAFAMAAGLWVGGKVPVVLIQNTGLLEAGDAIRGTVMRMRVPLLCLVTYRGYAKLQAQGGAVPTEALNADLLSRSDVDSVAVLTEPTLRAWNLPYEFVHEDADVARISQAARKARDTGQPMAVLITTETTG